jgi:BASS family bile acid:Na+ symporter
MKPIIDLGILLVNILMMMAVGLDLELRHFQQVARQKRALILSLAASSILLPLLGWALTHLLSLPPHVSSSILLLAACPNGDIVNFYAWLSRANIALAVTMTVISLLLSTITMPVIFEAYEHAFAAPFVFAVPPLGLILRLTMMVVLPIVFGMLIRYFKPGFPEKHGRSFRNASLLGVALLILFILINQAERLAAEWQQIALASAALILASLLLGFGLSRLARLNASDAFTIGTAFAARNAGLAVVIAITLLNRIEFATFATVYFLTEVPLLLVAVAIYRRNAKVEIQGSVLKIQKELL